MSAWARLPGLPVEHYEEGFLMRIGNALGKALKVDFQTLSAIRGKYARLCVEVGLKKPLVLFVWVDNELQVVEYEGLKAICFECGQYGHIATTCRSETGTPVAAAGDEGQDKTRKQEEAENNPYGPWMVASKRRTRVDGKARIGTV
ncbi:uncharacterized protein [Coffea arabica]|uniref:CCHC-type domain-containing protein n=1 Tax=Coffea arabica TaxID=13443 RepID=A0ABM4WMA4_COFAR